MTATSDLPEVWGGVECTVNRVGDAYFDQLDRTGHSFRDGDLERIASLGIRRLRYPLLWERIAPDRSEAARFDWSDDRLGRLRSLGIDPIVGLLHHGSGPRHTSLLDPGFPQALAAYARAIAERYPWVVHYTPINEPTTTARFSGLYGHWYPHRRDDRAFARAVVNQLRGIVLAMRAIREVNPGAKLVQTEDLGKTYATEELSYQADFENERRWLTFDALAGRLEPGSRMWDWLRWSGIDEHELHAMREDCCPPDVIGINHYLTSERFLDHRLDRYPPHTHGGNDQEPYADVEAVRVLAEGVAGPYRLLAEAWERYRLPLAVTEAHAGATRENQLRWLRELWTAACDLKREGADVRAVAIWALFGSLDWHVLLTRTDGRYEPGAFDVRSAVPRPTAIATMVRSIASEGGFTHPVLAGKGWWRDECRLVHDAHPSGSRPHMAAVPTPEECMARPILVAGAAGTLGRELGRACRERLLAHRMTSRRDLDVADRASVAAMLDAVEPWAVVNAAGFVRVDDAEVDREGCARDNVQAAAVLAEECARRGIALVAFSSDLVFGGGRGGEERDRPWVESDEPSPVCEYGRTKVMAEAAVLARLPSALVVRTSAFFGPRCDHDFVADALRSVEASSPFEAPFDEVVSPTYVPDLVDAVLDLLIDGEKGIWHLANAGALSWADFARAVLARAGLDPAWVRPTASAALGRRARRPRFTPLASERGTLLPSLEDAIGRYLAARTRCVQPA